MVDHKGVAYAYKLVLQAYFDTNDASQNISQWAQWQLPLATDQKQVTEDRMAQLQILLSINPDVQGKTWTQTDFSNLGITDSWLKSLLNPDPSHATQLQTIADVHTLYSSVAGIVTTTGNSADQTFSQNSQSAMGAATQSTSALSTTANMLQAFIQAMTAGVIKIL